MNDEQESAQSSATVLLTLALFIILLSFFIVLNSFSTFEKQKASSVLQSVELAFTSRIFKEDKAPSTKPDQLRLIGEGYSLKKLQGLFRASFETIDNMKVDTEKGLFYAEIPFKDLGTRVQALNDTEEDGQIRPGLMRTLIEMTNNEELNTRLDILVLTSDNIMSAYNSSNDNMREQRERLSGIAAFLERAGMPASSITIGFDKGRKDYVRIRVRNTITDNPAIQGRQ